MSAEFDQPSARVVGVTKPPATRRITSRIGSGRFNPEPHVFFDGAVADGVDFSGQRFRDLVTSRSTFVDCDFSRVRIDTGSFDATYTSRFIRCRFDALQPGALIWGVSRFEECSFEQMRLKDWRPEAAEFVGCRFSGRFDGIRLYGAPQAPYNQRDRLVPWRARNDFSGNDFSGAELRFPDFAWGVGLSDSRWPNGEEYLYLEQAQERLIATTAAVAQWPDDAERETALWWLQFQRADGRQLQQQTLIRRPDWEDIEPVAVWSRLWELLARPPDEPLSDHSLG